MRTQCKFRLHEWVMHSWMSHIRYQNTNVSYCRCPQARPSGVLKGICCSAEEVLCQSSQVGSHDPKVKKQKVMCFAVFCSVLQKLKLFQLYGCLTLAVSERVMSHIWISKVTHEWVVSHSFMGHITLLNESRFLLCAHLYMPRCIHTYLRACIHLNMLLYTWANMHRKMHPCIYTALIHA